MPAGAEMAAKAESRNSLTNDGAPHIQGYIDAIEPDRIFGWAWNASDPSERLAIEIRQGDQLIVRIGADQPRPDLVASGIGDGRYAFVAHVTAIGEIDRASSVSVHAMTADGNATVELKRQAGPPAQTSVSAAVIGEIRARDQRLQGQLKQLVTVARERGSIDHDLNGRVSASLDRLDSSLPEFDRRVVAIEVFELRFDAMLHQFEKRLRALEQKMRPRQPLWLVLWSALVTLAAAGLGAYIFFFLHLPAGG